MTRTVRVILISVLLGAGVALWWTIGEHAGASAGHVIAVAAALIIALIPATRNGIERLLQPVRHPSLSARRWTMVVIFFVSIAYILATSFWTQDRDLIPKFHDEHMHLLQVRMLAHGRLWTDPHPIADFFETFHVLTKPVYASIYFPGTALIYVPSVWLRLDFWVLPLCVAGACCAMLYRVVTELMDGEAGILAALLLLSLRWFRYLAMMVMSHSVMLLLGLLLIWAWLRWRRSRSIPWAAAIGAFAGWAAITRPVDALCYAIPVGVAMLIEMRQAPAKKIVTTLATIILCAAPFLALQLIQNIGITGQPFKTPYRLYADLYTPQMSFGFHQFDPNIRPQTTLRQRQDYYDLFTIPAAREHQPGTMLRIWWDKRLPILANSTLPNRLLLIVWPLGLLALPRLRWTTVLVVVLPLWVLMYAAFSYLLAWYAIVIAPAVIACLLLAKHVLRPGTASLFLTLAIAVLSIASLPEFDRELIDDGFLTPKMWFSYKILPREVPPPAIVLFHYETGDLIHTEPVYNIDVVNPDDAPIIRAHDLGERNRELFDYYAKCQPQRTVYLFDRGDHPLRKLGNVADLARRFPATQPVQ